MTNHPPSEQSMLIALDEHLMKGDTLMATLAVRALLEMIKE